MTDVKNFIRNLENAEAFFGTKKATIDRWLKTGSVPFKAVEKVLMAMEAAKITADKTGAIPAPAFAGTPIDNIDPVTHLPRNIDRRLPEIVPMAGQSLPATIEMSPTEQSFGNNFTRPGRMSPRPMAPMKLREENGHKVAYQENTPALADQKNEDGSPKTLTLPPSIAQSGWADKKDEPQPKTAAPETVSTEKV